MKFDWAELGPFLDRHPAAPFLFALCWIAGVMALSALVRIRRGKPLFARVPKDALFTESWTSGRSLRNLFTRMGRAKGALLVSLSPSKLVVRPHFPFSLMFLPELYGMEVEIAPGQLRSVEEKAGIFRKTIVVEYALPGRGDEQFELRLRKPKEFLKAVELFKARRPRR